MRERPGSSALLVIIVLLAGVGAAGTFAWVLPRRRVQERVQNERQASTRLKMLTAAVWDYRLNDRDKNGFNDFWTGDVTELYRYGLIEREVAEADASPLTPLCSSPIPFRGYYFMALRFDNSQSPPEDYRQDTDKKSGRVHHPEKFGFVAYPAVPGVTGHYIYIVNENNSLRRAHHSAGVPRDWPSDSVLSNNWSHFD